MSDIVEEEVNEEMEVVEEAEVEDANAVSSDSNKSESEEEEYEVERIVATRFVKKKQQYLVKWVNYDEQWNTWEPMENLEGSTDLVAAFNRAEREKEEEKERQKQEAIARKKAEKEKKEREKEERREEKEKMKRDKIKKEFVDSDEDQSTKQRGVKDVKSESAKGKEEKEKEKLKKPFLSKADIKRQKKKEKLNRDREKWQKEKADQRRQEEEKDRRKRAQNAYKKKESGLDLANTSLSDKFPDQELSAATTTTASGELDEKKVINEETQIEEQAQLRILLCLTRETYEWEQIGRKWAKILKSSKSDALKEVTIAIDDAGVAFDHHQHKSTIAHSEIIVTLTASPKLISLAVKDLVVRLTAERFKRIPKAKRT